jgi:hypothetical protein
VCILMPPRPGEVQGQRRGRSRRTWLDTSGVVSMNASRLSCLIMFSFYRPKDLAPLFLRKHCALGSQAYKVAHPPDRWTRTHQLLGLLACSYKTFHLNEAPETLHVPLYQKALQVPNIIIDPRKNPLQKSSLGAPKTPNKFV